MKNQPVMIKDRDDMRSRCKFNDFENIGFVGVGSVEGKNGEIIECGYDITVNYKKKCAVLNDGEVFTFNFTNGITIVLPREEATADRVRRIIRSNINLVDTAADRIVAGLAA